MVIYMKIFKNFQWKLIKFYNDNARHIRPIIFALALILLMEFLGFPFWYEASASN